MEIVECDIECLEVLVLLTGNAGDKFLRCNAFLAGLDHDWRAVRVRRANVGAQMAAKLLKPCPDIRLNVFNEVTHVHVAVRVGQRAGHHYSSKVCSHSLGRAVSCNAAHYATAELCAGDIGASYEWRLASVFEFVRVVDKFRELLFVIRLLVGFHSTDFALVDQFHQGRIHGLHTDCATALHRGFQLIQFSLADDIGNRRGVDEDFQRGNSTGLVFCWQ